MDKMSDVAGMEELRRMTDRLHQRPADIARVSALLRNRQELAAALDAIITSVGYGQGVSGAEWDAAKAALQRNKELDND